VTDDIVHEGNVLTIEGPGALQATRNGHARTAAANARRPRGVGRVYQPEYRDKKTGERRTVATWWIQYSHHGKVHREPSHSTSRPDAVRLLKKRLGEIGRGRLVGAIEDKVTFEDLAVDLVRDYALHERRSAHTLGGTLRPDGRLDLDHLAGRVRHLHDAFGRARALDITTDRIRAYQDTRRAAGASAATVNREVAALSKMFTLAVKAGRLGTRPPFPERLPEAPPRQGFFEAAEYHAIRRYLSEDHQDVLDFSYWSGWRPGAIAALTWPEIDLAAQVIRPRGGSRTKRRGQVGYAEIPALCGVLERRWAKRRLDTPLVFHVAGRPMGDWRKRWDRACLRAGFATQDAETKKITAHITGQGGTGVAPLGPWPLLSSHNSRTGPTPWTRAPGARPLALRRAREGARMVPCLTSRLVTYVRRQRPVCARSAAGP
jgi:integrase